MVPGEVQMGSLSLTSSICTDTREVVDNPY